MGEAPSVDHNPGPNDAPAINTRSLKSALESIQRRRFSSSTTPQTVYIVTDSCYPTTKDFDANKGHFSIDSVHSTKKTANARAKKMMYESAHCKVDIDKIIEEVCEAKGLYTGIGIGGIGDGKEGNCYARKCGVESKIVDEDSDDEAEEELSSSQGEREAGSATNASDGDGDVRMG